MPPANPIWIHFNKLGQVSGFQQPRTQYCNYEINAAVGKCVVYFKICSRVSITTLQGYFGPNFQPNANQRNSCLPIEQNNVITTRHSQNSSIDNFVDRISLVEQAEAGLLFAQAIYQCGLFLSLPELEPIKALFKKLHPCFKLPSQKTLSTTLLDQVHNNTKNEVDNIISSANYICLVSDGWINIMQEHWTNYLITTPKPIFFSAHQTGEIRHIGENIAADIENLILQIDHSKLSGVITDNASSMKKAWKLVAIRYPNVFFLGCVAHSLNLLIGDIMKLSWADTTMKNIKRTVKYFKSHQIPAAILKQYQLSNYNKQISLKLPVKTRWGSSAACLNSLQVNQLAIELTITKLSQNQALVIGISIFESGTPCLSGVLDWYYDQLESSGNRIILKIFYKKDGKAFIYHPIMEVAHLLDPSFHGCCLTSNSMHKISQFIQKFYSNDATIIWTQLLHYREKSGISANQLAWKTVGKVVPITWWSGNFIDSAPELT
nr:9870_t:CDS:2 [Entrophospora candida]